MKPREAPPASPHEPTPNKAILYKANVLCPATAVPIVRRPSTYSALRRSAYDDEVPALGNRAPADAVGTSLTTCPRRFLSPCEDVRLPRRSRRCSGTGDPGTPSKRPSIGHRRSSILSALAGSCLSGCTSGLAHACRLGVVPDGGPPFEGAAANEIFGSLWIAVPAAIPRMGVDGDRTRSRH